ncbi:Chitin synthase, class 5 [Tulasnella sp. 403]|nr:Chitin synthase, class 5 [Tulasnella sp. 403]
MDSFTFTVGKLDAGMAILIGERAHLIEFPSLLLPAGVTSGSIVNIAVHRNLAEEKRQRREFWDLQDKIYRTFGVEIPKAPQLQVRNITQTSVVLEWPPISLATANLRSLDIYRNGQRLAAIPSAIQNTSTKLSGLEQNTPYTFQLILRTTAGTYPSNVIKLQTHTMKDTSGISVCFGNVQDPKMLEDAKLALQDMGAKWSDRVQIDTTHFVCTTPTVTPLGASATGSVPAQPGVEYQKALQASIPIVLPHWILACYHSKKMVPISHYYLTANPTPTFQPFVRSNTRVDVSTPPSASSTNMSSNKSSTSVTSVEASTKASQTKVNSPPVAAQSSSSINSNGDDTDGQSTPTTPGSSLRASGNRRRQGTMQKDFRFPPPSPNATMKSSSPPSSEESQEASPPPQGKEVTDGGDAEKASPPLPAPVDVPPPVPVQKEKAHSMSSPSVDGDDELGETEEVDLS